MTIKLNEMDSRFELGLQVFALRYRFLATGHYYESGRYRLSNSMIVRIKGADVNDMRERVTKIYQDVADSYTYKTVRNKQKVGACAYFDYVGSCFEPPDPTNIPDPTHAYLVFFGRTEVEKRLLKEAISGIAKGCQGIEYADASILENNHYDNFKYFLSAHVRACCANEWEKFEPIPFPMALNQLDEDIAVRANLLALKSGELFYINFFQRI